MGSLKAHSLCSQTCRTSQVPAVPIPSPGARERSQRFNVLVEPGILEQRHVHPVPTKNDTKQCVSFLCLFCVFRVFRRWLPTRALLWWAVQSKFREQIKPKIPQKPTPLTNKCSFDVDQ